MLIILSIAVIALGIWNWALRSNVEKNQYLAMSLLRSWFPEINQQIYNSSILRGKDIRLGCHGVTTVALTEKTTGKMVAEIKLGYEECEVYFKGHPQGEVQDFSFDGEDIPEKIRDQLIPGLESFYLQKDSEAEVAEPTDFHCNPLNPIRERQRRGI